MKKIIAILFIVHVGALSLMAQHEYKYYKWSASPTISPMDENESSYPAVIIKEVVLVEHIVQASTPVSFKTVHRIIHINNDAGIEKYNKIYIPLRANNEIIDLQVRAISPSGKITPIQRNNIKELHNVEGYSNVKIFAIEGLEVGGEAEYLFTSKSGFEPFGRETIQQDIPIREAELILFYPAKWKIKTKSYNGLAHAETERMSSKKHLTSVTARDIAAYHEEDFALYEPRLMRFEYKFISNGYQTNSLSWKYLGDKLVSNLSTPKGSKAGYKFTKEFQNSGMQTEAKIRALENKIKSTIKLAKQSNEAMSDPGKIIKNGVGNSRGISKLFIYSLAALKIKNELVFACNRYRGELDPNFANPSDISDMLIYFPEFDTYLIPDAYHMRYGVAHTGLMGTNALFSKYTTNFNRLECSDYYFDKIKILDKDLNHLGVIAKIDFEEDLRMPAIEIENYSQGYRAFGLRSAYYNNDKSGQDEFIKYVTLSAYETFDIQKTEVEGSDMALSSFPEEYFRIKMQYTTPELVERAGNEYLISLGKVIGKQSELYQEKDRQHDIEFHSISNYHHEITVNIPEGYVIEGLENIIINNKVTVDGHDVMYFISDYTKYKDSLKISVDEVYSVLNLPKSKYDNFRNVINSAADFNKLTLVLRKGE